MILDGEEFSISEDGKVIKGKEKEYSEEDFHKEKGKNTPFLIAPREAARDGIGYGFSDEEKLSRGLLIFNVIIKKLPCANFS